MHACDRQTDRITTPKTALAYARAVKIDKQSRNGTKAKQKKFPTNAQAVASMSIGIEAMFPLAEDVSQ